MARAARTCSHNTPVPCGSPAERGGRCDVHARTTDAERGTAAQRGYGAAHQRARAALLRRRTALWRLFLGTGDATLLAEPLLRCPRCLQPIPPPEPPDRPDPQAVADADLHADHFGTRPPAPPDRLAHAACNVGAALHASGPRY